MDLQTYTYNKKTKTLSVVLETECNPAEVPAILAELEGRPAPADPPEKAPEPPKADKPKAEPKAEAPVEPPKEEPKDEAAEEEPKTKTAKVAPKKKTSKKTTVKTKPPEEPREQVEAELVEEPEPKAASPKAPTPKISEPTPCIELFDKQVVIAQETKVVAGETRKIMTLANGERILASLQGEVISRKKATDAQMVPAMAAHSKRWKAGMDWHGRTVESTSVISNWHVVLFLDDGVTLTIDHDDSVLNRRGPQTGSAKERAKGKGLDPAKAIAAYEAKELAEAAEATFDEPETEPAAEGSDELLEEAKPLKTPQEIMRLAINKLGKDKDKVKSWFMQNRTEVACLKRVAAGKYDQKLDRLWEIAIGV